MAKMYICDICDAREKPTSYDLPPGEWFAVSSYGKTGLSVHVCSVGCLQGFATRLQQERTATCPVPATAPSSNSSSTSTN